MKTYLNQIRGIPDAITSMYFTNHNWSHEKEQGIYELYNRATTRDGFINVDANSEDIKEYLRLIDLVKKIGKKHITLLRFIDITVSVEGLHRGGQDDLDSHAMRMNNRIIRMSSRLGKDFTSVPMSDYYADKVLTIEEALKETDIVLPDKVIKGGVTFVKGINGYVRADLVGKKDVERGLYPLGFASNCIFKCNITEWAHIYKERNIASGAHPELKDAIEDIQSQLESHYTMFDRELLLSIIN